MAEIIKNTCLLILNGSMVVFDAWMSSWGLPMTFVPLCLVQAACAAHAQTELAVELKSRKGWRK